MGSTLPATAQQSLEINNTGAASFRSPTDGTPRNIPSNQTQFTAVVETAVVEVVKTGDRAAAEPGDTVTYRVLVRNTGSATINNLVVQDVLPLGIQLIPDSVQVTLGGATTPISVQPTVTNRTINIPIPGSFAPQQTLTVAYSALLTPDAIRGSGRNLASAVGQTGTQEVRSNTASYVLRIRPGILSDCGTIVGRVFVDKNFDGEQQPGEAGVPNAVVFMDDGNRIVTDANGLFSVANVIAGSRTGALDLSSLPGYTLAPNLYRVEANSQSRLVRLSPGGLARMNFAVTPTFDESQP